jgi:hypothetical protein
MSLSRVRAVLPLLSVFLFACGATKSVDPEEFIGDDGTNSESGSDFDIGGDGISTDGPTLSGIELTPGNAVVTIDTATSPATAAKVTYKAVLNKDDGTSTDVSSSAAFSLDDPSLGTFAGPTFTSVTTLPGGKLGVTTVVHANAEGKSGAANLTIIMLRKSGEKKDFFFTVPYMAPPDPDKDILKFGTNIKQVDVAVNMDTTGSMSGSVENLRTNLSTTMFPELVKAIPSVGLAVVDHKDYPVCSHGGSTDFPARVYQIVTTDLKKAQDATTKYVASGGADGSESQIPSMWHILTGGALNWTGGTLPAHTPAPGTFGGVDFRPGSLPVIVLITDVSWHAPDAPSTIYDGPYCASVLSPPSMATLKTEFTKNNARFVDVTSTYGGEIQADDLSDATKSNIPSGAFGTTCPAGQCPTGASGACRAATGPGGTCRLNFLHSGGTGVSTSIVKAIQAISVGSQFDVTAVPSNDPKNAVGDDGKVVDATKFIKALRAMDEGDAKNMCPAHVAKDTNGDGIKDTFTAVVVGTPVCFEVLPQMNTTVKPKASAQFFNAFIDVLGMPGSVKLDLRTVLFLVPPRDLVAK